MRPIIIGFQVAGNTKTQPCMWTLTLNITYLCIYSAGWYQLKWANRYLNNRSWVVARTYRDGNNYSKTNVCVNALFTFFYIVISKRPMPFIGMSYFISHAYSLFDGLINHLPNSVSFSWLNHTHAYTHVQACREIHLLYFECIWVHVDMHIKLK